MTKNKTIKIVIADDHPMFRGGLMRLLETEPDIEVLAEAGSGREALDACRKLKPDVLLLDLDMPDMDGFEVTYEVKNSNLPVRVLVLTMHDHEEYAIRLIQSGAMGFMIKGSTPGELAPAIRKVAEGKTYMPLSFLEGITSRLIHSNGKQPISTLTDRELQVLTRLARGKSIKEISDELCLSSRTVDTYKSRAMQKLNLSSLSDIIRFAIHNKLVERF